MTTAVIISLCVLLLFAYLFDVTAAKTRIPTVVLLLSLGFILHLVADAFQIHFPDLSIVLPAVGTVGLILIVLEGALELELSMHKMPIIKKASLMAVVPLILLSFVAISYVLFTFYLVRSNAVKLRDDLLNQCQIALSHDPKPDQIEPINQLINSINTTKKGVYASFTQRPAIQAFLLPLSGLGGNELINYLMNFF